ncbi:hypothetical protein Glove_9g81 [Diversispora epigaea]|uniref:SAM domain-containing protein n=1 Tax=Diversispora epigaea TaxID=1348612 RepID=A0A397JRG3_9GLOM|nr:hypothetical protein Glove_9g81 [Diversispora epigaea]
MYRSNGFCASELAIYFEFLWGIREEIFHFFCAIKYNISFSILYIMKFNKAYSGLINKLPPSLATSNGPETLPHICITYKSTMSEQSTPASTSTTTTEEKPAPTLAEEVREYKTNELIEFLRKEEDLELDEDDLEILRKQKISGRAFLKLTEQKLERYGMKGGPATVLADFVKEVKEKKLRAYSSYKTQKDFEGVMRKFGIDGKNIRKIPSFSPETEKIEDNDEDLQYCVTDIKRRMDNLGSAEGSSDYITTILHNSLHIAKRITKKRISLEPEFEVIGDEATGRVDIAIKKVLDNLDEELICITEGKQSELAKGYMQNIIQLDSSYHTNKRKQTASEAFDDKFDYLYGIVSTAMDWHFIMYTPEKVYRVIDNYHVPLAENILEDDTELRRDVKKVMEVIVGLLKDRVNVDDSPAIKRARTEKYIKKRK